MKRAPLLYFPSFEMVHCKTILHPLRFHLSANRGTKLGLISHKFMIFITRGCLSISTWRVGSTEVHLPCGLKPLTPQAKAELSTTLQGGQVLKCSVLRGASSFTLPLVASPTLSLAPYLPHLSSSFPHPIPTVELSYPTFLNL